MFVWVISLEFISRSFSKIGWDILENGEIVIGVENLEKIDENLDKEMEVEEFLEKIKV